MRIYINNRADQREEIDDDELVQAFWDSEEGAAAHAGMTLERSVLAFLSRYGTFDISEAGTGYEQLFERVRRAWPKEVTR